MLIQINTGLSGCTNTVSLPLWGTLTSVTVDWGDGTALQTVSAPGDVSHTYTPAFSGVVTISGTVTQFGSTNNVSDCALTGVNDWGTIGITSLQSAFYGDKNLTSVPSPLPPGITDMNSMFYRATAFNQDVSSWDTSSVTDMSDMFYGATAFNNGGTALPTTSLGWNTSNVKNMTYMFGGATAFNQNVSSWHTSNVTTMNSMFYRATAFNNNNTALPTTARAGTRPSSLT
jgi:surface protein